MGFGGLGGMGRGFGHMGTPLGGVNYSPVAALGSDLLGYWEANRSDLITQSGGKVSSWKDVVAGYNVVQATDAAKPIYAANSFNGNPGITGDGVAQYLSLESVPFPTGAAPCEIWLLAIQTAQEADTNTRPAVSYGGTATSGARRIDRGVTGALNRAITTTGNGTSGVTDTDATSVFTLAHAVRAEFGATSTTLTVDDQAPSTTSVVPNTGTTRVRLFANTPNSASGFFQGTIAAVLVTNPLSTSKAAALRRWLLGRARTGNPYILSAQAVTPTQVSLGWPAVPNATQYRVFQNGAKIATITDLAALNYVAGSLTSGTTYYFNVIADGASAALWEGWAYCAPLASSGPLVLVSNFEELQAGAAITKIGLWSKTISSVQDSTAMDVDASKARTGSRSVKFDFKYADTSFDVHDEIFTFGNNVEAVLGQDRWYGFSTYIPSPWVQDTATNGDIIWQLHGANNGPAGGGPPPLAMFVYQNTAKFVLEGSSTASYPTTNPDRTELYTWDITGDLDHWVDTVVRVNFNYSGGLVQIWQRPAGGTWVKVVDASNVPTIYHIDGQLNETGPNPFFGPYKFFWNTQSTNVSERIMWADEIKIGGASATFNDVAPG